MFLHDGYLWDRRRLAGQRMSARRRRSQGVYLRELTSVYLAPVVCAGIGVDAGRLSLIGHVVAC